MYEGQYISLHNKLTWECVQKPIVCLLLLPPPQPRLGGTSTLPMIQLPSYYKPRPDPHAVIKRYMGKVLDRVIGVVWCLFALVGAGSSIIGLFNFFLGVGAWIWWKNNRARGNDHVWSLKNLTYLWFPGVEFWIQYSISTPESNVIHWI